MVGDYFRSRSEGSIRRGLRLAAAKLKGTHSRLEWEILHDIFGECVNCGTPYPDLNGGVATKDHIVPLYCGGCDCIANLQPVCQSCNSSGLGGEDLRASVIPGWQTIYLHKLGVYF